MWIDVIVIAVLAAIIGAICLYLHRQKKQGVKCVGCPHSKDCRGHCNCKN